MSNSQDKEQIGSQMNQTTSDRVVINVNSKEPELCVPELKGLSYVDMVREKIDPSADAMSSAQY